MSSIQQIAFDPPPEGAAPAADPFAPRHDKSYFYPEPTRAQRLKLLHHLAPYGELLVVTGEPGSGKTSLLEQFVDRAHAGWRLCVAAAEPGWGAEVFLDALIQGFDIRARAADSVGAKQDVLAGHCAALKRSGLVAVIVVDDAEHLAPAALEALLDLLQAVDAHDKPLKVVLFGAPRLRDSITASAPGLQERITHTFTLPPFSERETGNYLRHRLKVAGFGGNDPFTESVVKTIHRTSQGLPSKINELARVVMNNGPAGAGPARATRRPGGRNWSLLPMGVAAVVLAALAIYFIRHPAPPPAAAPGAGGATTVPLALPPDQAGDDTTVSAPRALGGMSAQAPGPATDAPAVAETAAPPAAAVARPKAPQAHAAAKSAPAVTAAPAPESNGSPAAAPAKPAAAAPKPVPAAAVAAAKTPAKPSKSQRPSAAAETKAPAKAEQARGAAEAHEIQAPTAAKAPEASAATLTAAAKAPAAPVPTATAAAKEPEPATAYHDAVWLLDRPAGHFTLQLMATRQADAVPRVVARSGEDPQRFALFSVLSRGDTWHILTYGDYPDRAQADARAADLPAGLRRFKPWVRPMSDLQAAARHYRDRQHP